jgi:large conductance mechanosensitive channel
MLSDFKQFLLRGNVIDLAVAVVVGVAFSGVVSALVADLITPPLAAIGGKPDFANLTLTINHSHFRYADFIDHVIDFVLVAAAVFFLIVKPINALIQRTRTAPSPDPTTNKCQQCLGEVPITATRCAYCTQELQPDIRPS